MRKIFITLIAGIFLSLNYINAQLTASMSSSEVDPGANATVNVTVNGFTNILGAQFSINYDSLVLEYVDAINFNGSLPGLSIAAVSGPNGVGVKKGQITFSWFDQQGTGKSLNNGSVLFSLVFKAIGAAGTKSDVVTSNVPRVIEIIDANLNPINLVNNKGTVTIKGTPPPPTGCVNPTCANPNSLTLSGDEVSGQKGTNVCVPIRVKNFTNLISGQGSIGWNPALLQYTEVKFPTTGGVPDFNAGVLNTTNVANGVISYVWFKQDTNPTSVPDNTILLEICYTIVGDPVQTACVEPNRSTPTAVEWESNNGVLPVCFSFGKVNITTVGPNPPVVIKAGTGTGRKGDTVCIDVTVEKFISVFGIETTFSWNPTQLRFIRTEMYDLDNLNPSAFNTNINNGTLKMSWTNGQALTRPDGHRIFKICFELLCPSTNNYTAAINFTGTTEISGTIGTNGPVTVPSQTSPGSIGITDCGGDPGPVMCTPGVIIQPDCNGGTNGSAAMTVTNATSDCVFQWKNVLTPSTIIKTGLVSAGNLNLTNVGAGNYVFDVLCSGVLRTSCSVTIGQPTAIVIPTAGVVTNEACGQKGAINISGTSGGSGGYTYNWNPAQGNIPNPSNLSAGTYNVTVTDSKGCTATAPFTVTDSQPNLSPVTITGTNVKCKDGNDGAALVVVSGGCTPYTYSWSGGLTGANPQNLRAGTYTVTVTDSAVPAHTGTATVTITEPALAVNITLTGTTDATSSTAADGRINITVSGGTPNYRTMWSGGIPDGTTSGALVVNNVRAGTYSVTITDANGCTAVRNAIEVGIVVTPPDTIVPELGVISIGSSFNGFGIKCFGENNGVITGSITKGTYPITITLRSGNQTVGTPIILQSGTTSFAFSNLVAGAYTVTASNSKGTSAPSSVITITQPTRLAATPIINCSNKNEETGTVEINLNNTGAGNYSFNWLGQSDLDNKIESVPVGFYNVTITDANGCELRLTNLEVKTCPIGGDCYNALTVITPNGDNFNDIFTINCVEENPGDLTVFDRWGREVYFQSNYDNTWQGIDNNGKNLIEGAYIWVLNVNFGQGRREVYKGTVTLLRAN